MSVFEYEDYKSYLSNYIKKSGKRGLISEMSRAISCTHSYLSQVLNGNSELTPDQAMAATDFLNLNTDESDYFFLLVLFSRSATQKLKLNLKSKLENIKNGQLKTSKVLTKLDNKLNLAQRDRYYSDANMASVHTLTASSKFQSAELISKRLNLSLQTVNQNLSWLIDQGLVEYKNGKYTHTGQSIHLPSESIHNHVNHLNWRLRAVQNSMDLESIHYTSVFAIAEKDWDKLRSDLIEFIKQQRKKIQNSGSEDGFTFCCDLFRF